MIFHGNIVPSSYSNILSMSSNRTTTQNKEQGSFCFTMLIEWKTNSCLALYSVLFEDIASLPYLLNICNLREMSEEISDAGLVKDRQVGVPLHGLVVGVPVHGFDLFKFFICDMNREKKKNKLNI